MYKNPQGSGQRKILNYLVNCICTNQQNIKDYEVSKIINGKKGIEGVVMDEILSNIHNPHYIEAFNSKIYQLLNPSKLDDIAKVLAYIIQNDSNIKDTCVVDYVSGTSKDKLDNIKNSNEFIAGVFLYILQCTENVHTEIYSSEITLNFCENSLLKFDVTPKNINYLNIVMDSDLESQAKAFCRKYENSIELLPLCQIANIVNPTHNHANKMYDEYCDCSDALKREIMKENDCPMLNVADEYALYRLLSRFADDIEKMGLASRDKKYMFQQYVVKSLYYEGLEPIDTNPTFFPIAPCKLFPNHKTSFLSQFVNDYLYYKDKDMDISLPIPLDWMFVNLNFGNCDEKDLIFWLNLFITSSCYDIQAYFKYDSKEELSIPNIEDTKTIEDLFFLSLLMLYDTYMNS